MRNNRSAAEKYLSGLASLLPAALAATDWLAVRLARPAQIPTFEGFDPNAAPLEIMRQFFTPFMSTLISFAWTTAIGLATIAGFMIHLFRSGRAAEDRRWAWAMALLFGAPISIPIYWYIHIWSPPMAGPASAPVTMRRSVKIALGFASITLLLLNILTFAFSAIGTGNAFFTMQKKLQANVPAGKMSDAEKRRAADNMVKSMIEEQAPTFQAEQMLNYANVALRAALTTIFVIAAFRCTRLDKNTLTIWVLLLLILARYAMPIYWYLYVWKDAPAGPNAAGAPSVG